MPYKKPVEVVRKVERFGVAIELYNDGQYLIILRGGKTLWATCTDLEDICALTPQIFSSFCKES